MKYLTRATPLGYEYYYEEDVYTLNDQIGGFQPNAQGSNLDNLRLG